MNAVINAVMNKDELLNSAGASAQAFCFLPFCRGLLGMSGRAVDFGHSTVRLRFLRAQLGRLFKVAKRSSVLLVLFGRLFLCQRLLRQRHTCEIKHVCRSRIFWIKLVRVVQ